MAGSRPADKQRRQLRRRRQRLEAVEHSLADPPRRHVDDAAQADIVVRIDDDLQVRQRVLDLAPLVESHAADDAVRHARAHQRIFYRARLRIRAVQDGDDVLRILRQRAPGGAHDEVRFLELVAAAEVEDLRAPLPIRPEPLLLAVAVLADHGGRRIEDHLRRAVVPLQPHDVGVGEVVLEIQDVLQVRAAPLVDRLVRVADDAEVAMALGQPAHQQVLRPVRVLVLVHHHEPELLAVPRRACAPRSRTGAPSSAAGRRSRARCSSRAPRCSRRRRARSARRGGSS